MPVFGQTVLSVDEAEPREVELQNEKGEGAGVFVLLRQLPKSTAERLSRPLQIRARRLNEKSTDAELNRLEEDTKRFKRESVSMTLADTRGMKWRFSGASAVNKYGAILGGGVVDKEPVSLDGKWTDSLKDALFSDEPWILDVMVEAYVRMTAISAQQEREDEEGKGEISVTG